MRPPAACRLLPAPHLHPSRPPCPPAPRPPCSHGRQPSVRLPAQRTRPGQGGVCSGGGALLQGSWGAAVGVWWHGGVVAWEKWEKTGCRGCEVARATCRAVGWVGGVGGVVGWVITRGTRPSLPPIMPPHQPASPANSPPTSPLRPRCQLRRCACASSWCVWCGRMWVPRWTPLWASWSNRCTMPSWHACLPR